MIDRKPRLLTNEQQMALEALSRQTMALLELKRVSNRLAHALENMRSLEGLIPICMYCKSIRNDGGYWERVEKYIRDRTSVTFSHGLCPECRATHFPEVDFPEKAAS